MNASPIALLIEALGWTLLHFLWQGAAVALVLWCFLRIAHNAAPHVRYTAGCAVLLIMLVGVTATFGRQLSLAARHAPAIATAASPIAPRSSAELTSPQAPHAMRDLIPADAVPAPTSDAGANASQSSQRTIAWPLPLERGLTALKSAVRPWLPWIVALWAAGVGLLSVRLLACWKAMRNVRSLGREPGGEQAVWIERFERLRQRLGVSRPVRLLCTTSAGVPMVIGWLKPVVLVPAGLLTGLSVPQLEAILAHELAHIRRHDYLVNLLQNVVETLFFYHPAVWWISGQLRREREHCCDDAASAVCGNAVDYARALARLEELRGLPAALGISAGGSTLPARIRRLVGVRPEPRGAGWPIVATVLAACAVVALLPPSGAGKGEEQSPVDSQDALEEKALSPSTEQADELRAADVVAGYRRNADRFQQMRVSLHRIDQLSDAWYKSNEKQAAALEKAADDPELPAADKESYLTQAKNYRSINEANPPETHHFHDFWTNGTDFQSRKPRVAGPLSEWPTEWRFGDDPITPETLLTAYKNYMIASHSPASSPHLRIWLGNRDDGGGASAMITDKKADQFEANFAFPPFGMRQAEWGSRTWWWGGQIRSWPPIDDFFSYPSDQIKLIGQEDIGGRRTYILRHVTLGPAQHKPKTEGRLEQATMVTAWVDPSRGFLPVRMEWHIKFVFNGEYLKRREHPFQTLEVSEIASVDTGGFYPTKGALTFYTVDPEWEGPTFSIDDVIAGKASQMPTVIYSVNSWEVQRIEANRRMPLEMFALPFPDITDVYDDTQSEAAGEEEDENEVSGGIRITVLDSTGKEPIREFRVIAGTRSGAAAEEFTKRTGREVVNWQPHTVRIGREGRYVWPLVRAYDEMALRVEAEGYAPQVWAWAKKADGAQQVIFKLPEDTGVQGRVLRPDGAPAAAATVALALPQKNAVIEQGRIRGAGEPLPDKPADRWRRPTIVRAGRDGRFVLPTETDPAAAVLVVHDSGVREMPYAEFQKAPEITLRRWGRIDGRVLWMDKPGADERITLSIWRDDYGYPGMIGSAAETRSDADGRFVFDKVLPGRAQISRPIALSEDDEGGTGEFIFDGLYTHVQVKPGEPTAALLGGRGRTVTGRLTGRDTWDGVTFHFHPDAPHVGFPGDNDAWKAFAKLRDSAIGPLFFRDKLAPDTDGTFEIPHLLPGRYQLFVTAPGVDNYAAYTVIKLDPEKPDEAPEPFDLGEIRVKAAETNAPQDEGPADRPPERKPREADPDSNQSTGITTIRGKAVDAETGEPVFPLITQAGRFLPAAPANVIWGFWGYSDGRSTARDGTFTTTVRWAEGRTARVVAGGYLPEPVLTEPPPTGEAVVDVVVRLKRGWLVRGRVLDHDGRPVEAAAVFAVGPAGPDDLAKPAFTDAAGRFELHVGEAKWLSIWSKSLDAWPVAIPEEGKVIAKLPEPAQIDVEYDIEDGAEKAMVSYQLRVETPVFREGEVVAIHEPLSRDLPVFRDVRSTVPINNGGNLSLEGLRPGKYQICRTVMNAVGDLGIGAALDRQFFELKPGETKTVRFVRETGARLRGKVTWPGGTDLAGIVVTVKSETTEKDPFLGFEWQTEFAADTAAKDGTFRTERIPPGRYLLVAEGYAVVADHHMPLTPLAPFPAGIARWVTPAYRAETAVDVPATGEVVVPELQLE